MREFLRDLDLDQETIDTIMAEHGKLVTKDKEDIQKYKSTIDDLKKQIESLPKSEEIENLKTKIADYEKKESDRIALEKEQKEENILTANINQAIEGKDFVNEYTKKSVVDEIKNALKDEKNIGKSAKEILNEITNGKDDLFKTPNQSKDMAGMDEDIDTSLSKEDFDKMGYKARIELKQSNPELFNKYNK